MRPWPALALLLAACRVEGPSDAACAEMCALAQHCGFLPSSLGGRVGDGAGALRTDCERRCVNSGDSAVIDGIAACFAHGPSGDECTFDDCQAAADCVQLSSHVPDAVLGERGIHIRLLDGVLWSVAFTGEVCADADPMVASDFGLDNYCAVFYDADGQRIDDGYACAGLPEQPPLCSPADCETQTGCDPTLCYSPGIGADADCSYYGIESVQIGYRDFNGVLQLSTDHMSCAAASEGRSFPDAASASDVVPYGPILPIALFHGQFSALVARDLGLPDEVIGRPFCWASFPAEYRLARAGQTEFVVPTPSVAQLRDKVYERNREFPIGCGCVFDTIDCEETAEDCANGLDDDQDGLIDALDFGCHPPAEQECADGIDNDADGLADQSERDDCEQCGDGDPDDDRDGRHESAEPECVRCGDGIIGPGEQCDDPGDATCVACRRP